MPKCSSHTAGMFCANTATTRQRVVAVDSYDVVALDAEASEGGGEAEAARPRPASPATARCAPRRRCLRLQRTRRSGHTSAARSRKLMGVSGAWLAAQSTAC
ncbi:hypothetical protein E2562_036409 [Oryza meyeriana var. granulata]|uniref:Uncharacterized protein n=1 Tax=Oryza meyeriana var. granulata TaxID=110450 RepID=A0A6G1E809_9ORYZ|nr:hypothetical protein E2562_036409 [Oryza meyeriana var. granulata]